MILFDRRDERREANRIAVVDDDDDVRRSTAFLLRQYGYWVDEHESGEAFLAAGPLDEVAAIILDLRLPGRDGLAVLAALGERELAPPVIMLTGEAGVTEAVAAMRSGAVDLLEKPCPPETLLEAVRQLTVRRTEERREREARRAAMRLISSLSGRQRQVLAGVLQGKLNKTIAFELGISVRTVEAYRAELFERLGLRSTADAIWLAATAGWDGGMAPTANDACARDHGWPTASWAEPSRRPQALS